jgi:hypothetical protein
MTAVFDDTTARNKHRIKTKTVRLSKVKEPQNGNFRTERQLSLSQNKREPAKLTSWVFS